MADAVFYPIVTYTSPDGHEIDFRADGADLLKGVEGLSNVESDFHTIHTPYTHGSALVSGVAEERIISVHVLMQSTDDMSFRDLAKRWNDILNPFRYGPDRVTTGVFRYQSCEEDPVYEIDAAPLGKPGIKDETPAWSTRSYDFVCPYPFFRRIPNITVAQTLSASGFDIPWSIPTNITSGNCTLSFWMDGNIPAPPVITISGPASDIWVVHEETETYMRLNLALASGQTLVLDAKEKTARVGDINVAGTVDAASTFPTCVAGDNTFNISVDSGSPTVKISAPHLFSGVR